MAWLQLQCGFPNTGARTHTHIHTVYTYLDCLAVSGSSGCWEVQWVSAPEEDLKAMGQEGHLWKTSQWAVCMWVFTAFRLFTPPNTKWQQAHLQTRGNSYFINHWIKQGIYSYILLLCVDTYIQGDVSSAGRFDSGGFWGHEADRWHHIQGKPVEGAADVTGGELQHCMSSTVALEENTACNTREKSKCNNFVNIIIKYIIIVFFLWKC